MRVVTAWNWSPRSKTSAVIRKDMFADHQTSDPPTCATDSVDMR